MDKTDKLIKQFGKVTTPSVVPIADDILIPNHSGITGNKDAMNKLTLQQVTDNGAITTNDITFKQNSLNISFQNASASKLVEINGNANDGFIDVYQGGTKVATFGALNTAILTLISTTKGFLPPRMTTAQKNAIGSPAEGLQVYDLTEHKLYEYDGTSWQAMR